MMATPCCHKRRNEYSPYFARSNVVPHASLTKSVSSPHFECVAFNSVETFPSAHNAPLLCPDCARTAERQLCRQACFLKAHAPLREWHYLRKLIVECGSTDTKSPDELLKGWKCALVSAESPKAFFTSPEGKLFTNKSAILRDLGIPTEAVTCRPAKAKRKRESDDDDDNDITWLSRAPKCVPSQPLVHTDSPFGLLEELFVEDPWRLLLSTIFLNRTTRTQVDYVLHEFLQKWPTAEAVTTSTPNTWQHMSCVIAPLGIRHRRAKGIIQFSQDYLTLLQHYPNPRKWTRDEITSLYHCGAYAYDAYRLFILRDLSEMPTDKALEDYTCYQRAKQRQLENDCG